MDDAQRAQRFNQCNFTLIKLTKFIVAIQQVTKTSLRVAPIARHEHPQILHGRTGCRVIEVQQLRYVITPPENVAGMKIAMQA